MFPRVTQWGPSPHVFVEGLPVSEVCRKYDISVTNFYNWQKILF
jgi:transposase-like protein